VPVYGETVRLGRLTWQVVGPDPGLAAGRVGTEGSGANNASVTLLVESAGVRLLLSGDIEPEAQRSLAPVLRGVRVDVLKVPHHGSRYQDPEFLTGLGARLAIVTVGDGNRHGHPAKETLDLLREAGMVLRRTDEHGDVAVLSGGGQLTVRELSTSSSSMR
jgi:competence protein ComEC